MIDTSTFTGLHGEMAEQVMGCSKGFAEYQAGYEAAEDKSAYNAELLSKFWGRDEKKDAQPR